MSVSEAQGSHRNNDGGGGTRKEQSRSMLHALRVPWVLVGLYAGILAFFTAFFIWPVAIAIRGAFLHQTGSLTFAYIVEVFRNPIYVEGFLNTLKIAIGSTLVVFILAAPLAWVGHRFDFRGKS